MNQRVQMVTLTVIVAGVLLLGGCSKKVAKVVPPPAPAPAAAPTATLAANPAVVQQGQATELTWNTKNANSITIEGVGTVTASGSRSVTPGSSTTYTLVAKGVGGTGEASARVTVKPVATAMSAAPSMTEEQLFAKNVKDIYFNYDKADLRADDRPAADGDAGFLARHPDIKVMIEGHCDDRGSEEYNLALGDSRANSLKSALLAQGVSADRVKTVSYGKEKPFCTQDNDSCWQENRRDHFDLQH